LVSIDGSTGEGGGQVLRTAVALAAVTESDLKITNIRAGREEPGLKAQHLAGVRAVAALCDAEVEGGAVGSTELRFRPESLHGGVFTFDVGTAGAIPLVLQAVLPPAVRCGERVHMTVRGGTDVTMAPTIDYMTHVLLPVLRTLGARVNVQVLRRGFYPEGGGEVTVIVDPTNVLKPFAPMGGQPRPGIEGRIVAAKLTADIAERTQRAMLSKMQHLRVGHIRIEEVEAASAGVSATLWCRRRGGAIGGSGVGKRGYSSEDLGASTAGPLVRALKADVDVDEQLFDQVLLYCIMATGRSSFTFEAMTPHAQTLLDVAYAFAPFNRQIDQDGRRQRVVIEGEGL